MNYLETERPALKVRFEKTSADCFNAIFGQFLFGDIDIPSTHLVEASKYRSSGDD